MDVEVAVDVDEELLYGASGCATPCKLLSGSTYANFSIL